MTRPLLIILMAGCILLSACDDITGAVKANADANLATAQAQAAQGEAQRLAAETTRAQAAAQAHTTQALIDAQNARISDYQAVLVMAFILAAGSMAISLAMALTLRNTNRQPTYYQRYQVTPADPQAQISTPASWPEIRAYRRAVAELQARNAER